MSDSSSVANHLRRESKGKRKVEVESFGLIHNTRMLPPFNILADTLNDAYPIGKWITREGKQIEKHTPEGGLLLLQFSKDKQRVHLIHLLLSLYQQRRVFEEVDFAAPEVIRLKLLQRFAQRRGKWEKWSKSEEDESRIILQILVFAAQICTPQSFDLKPLAKILKMAPAKLATYGRMVGGTVSNGSFSVRLPLTLIDALLQKEAPEANLIKG